MQKNKKLFGSVKSDRRMQIIAASLVTVIVVAAVAMINSGDSVNASSKQTASAKPASQNTPVASTTKSGKTTVSSKRTAGKVARFKPVTELKKSDSFSRSGPPTKRLSSR